MRNVVIQMAPELGRPPVNGVTFLASMTRCHLPGDSLGSYNTQVHSYILAVLPTVGPVEFLTMGILNNLREMRCVAGQQHHVAQLLHTNVQRF